MDLYQLNEHHHRDRAAYWLQQGRPDYAQGSIRKAAKWQDKRREFDYVMNGAYPKNAIDDLIDQYMKARTRKVISVFASALHFTMGD
jgi:hypothetical protein